MESKVKELVQEVLYKYLMRCKENEIKKKESLNRIDTDGLKEGDIIIFKRKKRQPPEGV
jgi:hypothetical protein